MPLVFKRPVGEGFLALWRREESTEQLLSGLELSPEEQACYEKFPEQSKRKDEWLTWHRMVRELLSPHASCSYNRQGAPVLVNHEGHISVSHSDNLVVLYYQPQWCGTDIENTGRRFEKVAERYISETEKQLASVSDTPCFPAIAWCVKETAYKYARISGLNLLGDIEIQKIDTSASETEILIRQTQKIRIKYEFLDGYCLAYTIHA